MISGKEALIALANGEDVQYKFPGGTWMDFTTNLNLRGSGLKVVDFLNDYAEFRLKARTITTNGIEVPAPFNPPENIDNSLLWWVLDTDQECGYSQCRNPEHPSNLLGAWRTEEEIKQVVAALRSIFNPQ